ncbi:Gfo/Idh/MocA family protein [Paenibacillus turpanensis]|uniref:Gfo/Idh/MocA family protein n=1 Tax=Paenibacillus turpanensis TaxID=2689078 RepID=UPI00140C4AE0|nr:Gfo/Idh/MocA family oxidoreductase [Paenibacillus turpanensis]
MNQVRWGIMGNAGIAKTQVMPAMQRDEQSKLAAIASLSGKAEETAQQFAIGKVHSSYEALLADPDVDAVYIPLPNSLHKEWVLKAAEQGKHILCEKPAALNAAEMAEMAEACRQHGVIFMEAFMYRFHPQHQRVRELIASGEIGEVRVFRASFSFFLSEPKGNIRMDRQLGGGSLYDVGCYCVNSLRYVLGEEPVEIHAFGKVDAEYGVDTVMTINAKLNSGIAAVLDCGFEMHDRQQYEVVGTKGSIIVPRAYRPDLAGGDGLIQVVKNGVLEREETVSGDQYLNQVRHFTECVLKGGEPSYSAENTLRNMKVIDACYESLHEGRIVSLPQG